MNRFRIPGWVKEHLFQYDTLNDISPDKLDSIKRGLQQFHVEKPAASIVIPAYNEEKEIVRTLSSFSQLKPDVPIELIVANNNSTDRTQDILDTLGVRSVFVKEQGISYARQGGLEAAQGDVIISADADSLYPPKYGRLYYQELVKNQNTACVYGRYSFIPGPGNTRFALACHELLAEQAFRLRNHRQEAVNVMGFTFAYRRKDGLAVGGFKHDLNRKVTGRSEDGWMALELSRLGSIKLIAHPETRVWTSDRRLLESGSMLKAFAFRARKEIKSWF